jgi:hypothetical protein
MIDTATVTPAPAFSAVPLPEPPKRGRGRPRKDGTTGDSAPRTPGAPRGSRSIRTEVGSLLVTVNLPLSMFLPVDALGPEEIDALAMSIEDQCKRSPRFKSYVLQALKVQSATSLLAVVAMIGGRRAARHGIIPEAMQPQQLDNALGIALQMMTGTASVTPVPFTPPAYTPPLEPVTEFTDLSDRVASGKAPLGPNGDPLPPLAFTPPVG